MEQEIRIRSKKCARCGNKKFRQEVIEIYNRYLNSDGKITDFEDELTHDFEFGKIRCVKCGSDLEE
ncbi:hypothetical protein HYV49_01205 [Candidatus Pacearchaeota archaeon]|nr:hypothetical protein [Candidatus Pacearchaeota archaeon]